MFVCTMSDKIVSVEYKGKHYHFENTAWAGWVCCDKDYQGVTRNHPHGAWSELKRLHDPGILI